MAGTSDAQALLLTISADTTKVTKSLDALNKRLSGIGPEMERHGRKAAEGLERGLGSIRPGEALRKVFDSARFNVIEEGSAKLRIFGSAIEPLGPLGIAAAAGVVALGAAFEESRKAIEYADSLYKAATAAHVSTDALQEYRAAIVKAGGDANAAGPALLTFSQNLGKAQEGLAKGLRPFAALGFSKGQVQGFSGSEQALDAVVARIQQLKSRSQQDAVIGQLGLEGLAPLILAGAEAWKAYREEAKAAGLVLDKDVIRRGHELNVQMDELAGKIKNELTDAFIAVGPTLVGLLGMLAKALDFLKDINILRASQSALSANGGVRFGGDILNSDGSVSSALDVARSAFARSDHGVSEGITEAQLQAGLGLPKDNRGLKDLSKTPKVKNDFAERAGEAQKELDKEQQDLLKAQAALTENVQQHADLEKLASAAARDQVFDQINQAEQKAIQAAIDKKLTEAQRDLLLKQYELAKAVADQVLGEQNALADRKAIWETVDREVVLGKQDAAALEAKYRLTAATAVTAADRNDAERHLLAIAQRQQTNDSERDIARGLEDGRYTQDDASRIRANRETIQSAARQQQDHDLEGPLQKYLDRIKDLNTAFQEDGVEAIQSLTAGLIDAAFHAKNLGDVLKNTFLTLLQQVLTQSLTKEAAPGLAQAGAALLHFIPGFASGTPSAPGGLALVGENGPELVNLPKGAAVTPTFQTLQALSAMKAPRAAGVTVIQPFHFHAEGAVVSQDILDQANATAARFAAQAGQAARAAAVTDIHRSAYLASVNG